MKIDRVRNTKAGILTGVVKQLVNLGLPFITRTALLYILGTQYLGLGSLFSSLLSFLSLAELGVSNALTYSMYRPIAENDSQTICALLALYRKLYRIIGTFILTAGVVCMPFLRYLIKGSVPTDVNIYILYSFYLLNTVSSYFLYAYRGSLLIAHQRLDVENMVNTVIPLVNWCIQMCALLFFRSYYAYIIFLPISTIATNFVRLYYVKKLYPNYVPEGQVSDELQASITKKMKALVGAKISTVVLHSSDNIVISAFLGLTMVTIYGNYYYIMNAVCGFLGIVYATLLPGIGNSLVTQSEEKNYEEFQNLTFINMWIVSWCSICLLCLYQPFMTLWAGEELVLPFSVVVLIAIYFLLYQGRRIVITYKDAAGLWWEDRFRPFVMAGVNVVSNIILVQLIGIWGIVLSTILSLCVSIPWENYTVYKYVFKRSIREYYLSLLKYGVVLLIAAAVTFAVCQVVKTGVLAILLRGVICVIVPNLIFIVMFRKQKEFIRAKQIAISIFRR